jgi:hypothetical protein
VFKFAIAFHAICGAISLGVLTLFWQVGANAGFTDKVINFLVDIGFAESVRISGSRLFRGASTITAGLVLHNTVVTVLLAALYNLLSGLLGGLIVSVVEDDQIRPVGRRSTSALTQGPTEETSRPEKKKRERDRQRTPQQVPRSVEKPRGRRPRSAENDGGADATTLLPRQPAIGADGAQPGARGAATTSSSTFVETHDDMDDADWLAALADDTFDNDLDQVIDQPYQRHLGTTGSTTNPDD